MKILITGNLGYVGSALCDYLSRQYTHLELTGLDSGFFLDSSISSRTRESPVTQIMGDIRDVTPAMLKGTNAIVHLAAISNDPMGNKFESITDAINRQGTRQLATAAAEAGVSSFVLASSCSMYGQSTAGRRKETDSLNPLTAYARSKVQAEMDLRDMAFKKMTISCLRFATACGWSERLRLDLVLNDFVACALSSRTITLLSDGMALRPIIDVEDMARAITWAVFRNRDNGGQYLAVNAGANDSNYRIKDLAEIVSQEIPGTAVKIDGSAAADSRSYSVDFSLFETIATNYQPSIPIKKSISRLVEGLQQHNFRDTDFRKSELVRLIALNEKIQDGRLNEELRWTT